MNFIAGLLKHSSDTKLQSHCNSRRGNDMFLTRCHIVAVAGSVGVFGSSAVAIADFLYLWLYRDQQRRLSLNGRAPRAAAAHAPRPVSVCFRFLFQFLPNRISRSVTPPSVGVFWRVCNGIARTGDSRPLQSFWINRRANSELQLQPPRMTCTIVWPDCVYNPREWMNEWMNEWINEWINKQTNKQTTNERRIIDYI